MQPEVEEDLRRGVVDYFSEQLNVECQYVKDENGWSSLIVPFKTGGFMRITDRWEVQVPLLGTLVSQIIRICHYTAEGKLLEGTIHKTSFLATIQYCEYMLGLDEGNFA